MAKCALGMDLGTTFSSVCIVIGNKIDVVADKFDISLIPSVSGFKKKENKLEVYIGKYAQRIQKRNPTMVVYDSKRMIAQRFDDDIIQKLKNIWPFHIEKSETGNILIALNEINKKYEPYQILGEILKYLARVGNSHLTKNFRTNKVVITIPANFGEEQRQETIKAAEYAKLKVLRILNEPTAAGIAYLNDNQRNYDGYILIFDFGGGTLDVSLLHVNNNIITVTATDGDMFLGGRDFDERTTEYLLKKYKIETNNNLKKILKFKKAVKKAKENLSTHPDYEFDLLSFNTEKDYETLTLEEFEAINKELIDRITIPIERLLKKINFSKEDVDSIILVGGSSNMKFVKKKLKEFFGKEPILKINPNYAVVTGAGIIAAKEINNESLPFQLRNIEFRDICPFSIGTYTNDGTFSIIIDKNKPIPAHGCERFHTILYRQESFCIKVYECYDASAKNKKYLTKLDVYDLPSSEDEICFDIDFFLDENNILKVTAKLVDDGKKYEKKIEIKRINPHSIINNTIDADDEVLMNDFDIFFANINSFIDYNRESLESFEEINIDKIKKDIENQQNNPDLKPTDLKTLAGSFVSQFKPYFQKHPLPKFLQY